MRPVALEGGKNSVSFARRAFLKAGGACLVLGSINLAAAQPGVLVPSVSYMGAKLLRRVDPQGLPDIRSDTFGQIVVFVQPVAVAVSPLDIYIADAGQSTLFRYDPMLDAMAVVPGVMVTQHTKIATFPDSSVVVAEGRGGSTKRYSRTGRLLQNVDPQNTNSRFDDILVDQSTGRYIGLDKVQRRIYEVQPVGTIATTLSEHLLPRLPTAVALDGEILYAGDQDCQCVIAIDLFRRQKQVVMEGITQATNMAAGDGWLVVVDSVERVMRIYRNRILVGEPSYETLGLFNPKGIAVSKGTLYVADPGTRRITTFRLLP